MMSSSLPFWLGCVSLGANVAQLQCRAHVLLTPDPILPAQVTAP
jgi:hypothetical protein